MVTIKSAGIQKGRFKPTEVSLSKQRGLPGLKLVNAAGIKKREFYHLVKAAIVNSGFSFPRFKVIIDLGLDGSLDVYHPALPTVIGLLILTGQIDTSLAKAIYIGKLLLDGSIKTNDEILLAAAEHCAQNSKTNTIACQNKNAKSLGLSNWQIKRLSTTRRPDLANPTKHQVKQRFQVKDYNNIKISVTTTQELLLKLLIISNLNALIIGPPGCGKTTALEVIRNAKKTLHLSQIKTPINLKRLKIDPISPSQNITAVQLLGGKVTRGLLEGKRSSLIELNEIAEFKTEVLTNLKSYMDNYPSNQVLATSNPRNSESIEAKYIAEDYETKQYLSRIPIGLLDRFDLVYFWEKDSLEKSTETSVKSLRKDLYSKKANVTNKNTKSSQDLTNQAKSLSYSRRKIKSLVKTYRSLCEIRQDHRALGISQLAIELTNDKFLREVIKS